MEGFREIEFFLYPYLHSLKGHADCWIVGKLNHHGGDLSISNFKGVVRELLGRLHMDGAPYLLKRELRELLY